MRIKTPYNNKDFVSPAGREMKAMLNETYGCRFYFMKLPLFEVEGSNSASADKAGDGIAIGRVRLFNFSFVRGVTPGS